MNFIGLIGDMGSGKTCFATAILKMNHDTGRKVGANYKLGFESELMSFAELKEFPAKFYQMDYVADELGTGADSYEFMGEQAKNIGKLVTQVRKRECRVYYTVQRFNFIARRLRQMTDGFIMFRDLDSHLDHLVKDFVCAGLFELEFLDADMRRTRDNEIFDGKQFWHLYDTKEIIW